MLLCVVVVTAALAISNTQADRCGYFHEGCSVELGFGELILKCTLSSGNLTVKVDRSASYLKIICEEPFTPLLCDKLEYAKKYIDIYIDTSRKNKNLESLFIKTCNMPSESLACFLGMVGANGTSEVTLSEVEGDLKAVNLKGMEGVTKFVIVDFRIFHSTGSIPYKALSHLPNLRSLFIYGDVNVISEPDYVLSELKTLEVVRGTIECMSKGAFKSTPEIQMLSFDRDEILFIDVDAFEGLNKLVNFTLRYTNFWRQLPGGIFRHTPNLLYLSLFGSSSVRDFPDDLFTGLNKVKQISITHIEAKWILSNKTFSNLPSLYDLQLENSLIEIIPAEPFQNSTNLKKIHNNISYLNSDVFSEQTSMTELNLSHNDLKSLPGKLFSNMNSLKILDLGHNSIEFLNESIFNGLGNLRELSLNDNQLEHLDNAIFEFTRSLEVLSLSHNKLTISKGKNVRKIIEVSLSLDGEESASRVIAYHSPLKNLVRLRTLDLSHNNVFIICEDWTKMFNLTELDLSFNNFTSLSFGDFNFPKDAKINLKSNNIERLDVPINSQYTTEGTFLIDDNPFTCDCNLYNSIQNYKLGTKMFNINIEHAECAQPPALKEVKLVNLQPEVLTCDVD